jgi:Acyltransferase family.
MTSKTNRYAGIDILKFLFVFCIIGGHVSVINSLPLYLFFNSFCRMCVPYYFIASGYFCYKKAGVDRNSLNKSTNYLKKIFRLYLIWTMIYLPSIFKGMFLDNPKGHSGLYIFIRWFVLQFILSGNDTHLWYLNATIIAIVLIGLTFKNRTKA